MSKDINPENDSSIDITSLKLKPGTWLQLDNLKGTQKKSEVEFVSAMHGKGLFVAIPNLPADDIRIKTGEQYRVSGFNGISDFTFTSEVLEIQSKPFLYAHLTYPSSVDSRVVREVLRLRASLPSIVLLDGGDKKFSAFVNDISVAGAMIESAEPLGAVGDLVEIRIPTKFEARETELKITAMIRHSARWDPNFSYRSGVEYTEISREDKLVLYYLMFTLAQNDG